MRIKNLVWIMIVVVAKTCVQTECKMSNSLNLKLGDILLKEKNYTITRIERKHKEKGELEVSNNVKWKITTKEIPSCPNTPCCSKAVTINRDKCLALYPDIIKDNKTVEYDLRWHTRDRTKSECNCLKGECHNNQVCITQLEYSQILENWKEKIYNFQYWQVWSGQTLLMDINYDDINIEGVLRQTVIILEPEKYFLAFMSPTKKKWIFNDRIINNNISLSKEEILYMGGEKVCSTEKYNQCKRGQLKINCNKCEIVINNADIPCYFEKNLIICDEQELSIMNCENLEFDNVTYCKNNHEEQNFSHYQESNERTDPNNGGKKILISKKMRNKAVAIIVILIVIAIVGTIITTTITILVLILLLKIL